MIDIIDFVLANADSIAYYEVISYSMYVCVVEFTLVDGEKILMDF